MGRNMLVDGEWRTDVEPHTNEDGEFDRVTTSFRDWVQDEPGADFQPAADRYHLYVARNCPWAHGAALTRRLAGLSDAVTMDVVDPIREDEGWEFTPDKDGCTPDTVNGADYLREVYVEADPEFTGRVTVPVLWDKETDTIVNNESIEIMRMFATEFGDVGDDGVASVAACCKRAVSSTCPDPGRRAGSHSRCGFCSGQRDTDDTNAW